MCGRYTVSNPDQILVDLQVETFGMELVPRYNVAPTQDVPVIRQAPDGARHLGFLRWGLIPFWAKDPSIGNRMINARSETVAEKPSFRHAVKRRRCLMITDGFFEWQKVDGGKQPIYIHRPDRRPFVFAGLWERWSKGEQPIESCTILTTSPNAVMEPVHNRMPVILDGEARDFWLDPSIEDAAAFEPVLKPYEGALALTPVSRFVNNPRNDSTECIVPVH